jgi:hypothetical protein
MTPTVVFFSLQGMAWRKNKVPKIKKILPYEIKFLVPNYSCLQNPCLGGFRPQIPILSVFCPQLNLLNPPPPPEKNSWVCHCFWAKKINTECGKLSTLHYVVVRCYWKVLNLTTFFEEPIIRVMIQNWLIPKLKHTGIIALVWFQHDGGVAHFVLTVNVIINRSFWNVGLIVLQLHCHHCHGPTWPHQTTASEDSSMKKWLKTSTTKAVNCESL